MGLPPFVRIVMPVLNEGAALAARLAALQPLRAQGAEIVVVDGGSVDDSLSLARIGADAVRRSPRGRAAQMNAGARGAEADVLLFLHADTALPDGCLPAIREAFQKGARWGRFDVRLDSARPLLRCIAGLMNWRSRWSGIATGDQAMFVARTAFEAAGGFPDIALMEDIALSARLKKIAPPACLRLRVVTSARRWEQHGAWRTIWLMWRLRAAYFLGADPDVLARRYGYAPRTAESAPADFVAAVLAKAPVAGLAKTRLAPLLGAAGAARAQRRFTRHTLETTLGANPRAVTLWCAPDVTHPFFRAVARVCGVACLAQLPGDLGRRMQHAFEHHFAEAGAPPLLLMGTDCPGLASRHLAQAARALGTRDAVFIPAEDGGYVLVGLRRLLPEVFRGIAWSTPEVMQQTRARLRATGVRWTELEPLWDVDEPADWLRLQKSTAETSGKHSDGQTSAA
jgi:rSAM/selenodomain-associated transferase 2/rSAM/selenodomain-associated transferase 1